MLRDTWHVTNVTRPLRWWCSWWLEINTRYLPGCSWDHQSVGSFQLDPSPTVIIIITSNQPILATITSDHHFEDWGHYHCTLVVVRRIPWTFALTLNIYIFYIGMQTWLLSTLLSSMTSMRKPFCTCTFYEYTCTFYECEARKRNAASRPTWEKISRSLMADSKVFTRTTIFCVKGNPVIQQQKCLHEWMVGGGKDVIMFKEETTL